MQAGKGTEAPTEASETKQLLANVLECRVSDSPEKASKGTKDEARDDNCDNRQ
tara:strand:+ start:210 stop:368 length:159 start_codon:yes stop_codon:yes gene_type:complete